MATRADRLGGKKSHAKKPARKVTPLELVATPKKRGKKREAPKTWKQVKSNAKTPERPKLPTAPKNRYERAGKSAPKGGDSVSKIIHFLGRQPKAAVQDARGALALAQSEFDSAASGVAHARLDRSGGSTLSDAKAHQVKVKAAGIPSVKEFRRNAAKATKDSAAVMDVTSRPSYAISAGAKAAVKGQNVLEGAKAGLKGKDRGGFSSVLKAAGVHSKAVQAVAGFGLDVVLDPTTYATFGASTPAEAAAKQVAKKAAIKATEDALKSGATKEVANRAGRKAAATAVSKLPKHKGIQAGLRVHIPFTDKTVEKHTSGKATAGLSKTLGVSKGSTKVRESAGGQALGESFLHDFRPKDVTKAEHKAVRTSGRRARAAITDATRTTERKAKGLTKASGGEHDKVISDIESGKPKGDVAKNVAADFRKSLEAERKAGVRDTSIDDGYFPHFQSKYVDKKAAKAAKKQKLPSKVKPEKAHQRTHVGNIDEANAEMGHAAESPLAFSKDVPKVYAHKLERAAKSAALGEHWQNIVKAGRKVQPGKPLQLHEGESIYKVTPRGPERVASNSEEDKNLISRIASGKHTEHGRNLSKEEVARSNYVILKDRVVEDAKRAVSGIGVQSDNPLGRSYDRVQGAWKLAVTAPLPSYHARNLIGDSFNAYLADTTAKSGKEALAILKARHARNRVEASAESFTDKRATVPELQKTVKIGGKPVTYDQLLREAEKEGAVGTGFIGKDVNSLLELDAAKTKVGKATRSLSAASQYREDLPRMATFLSARKRGLSPSEAADWVNKHHFDYGDMTNAERHIRRAIPFWTFYARNSRLQATKVLERPGKYATFNKLLNDTAKAAGYGDYEQYIRQHKDYQQRGLPIPVKVGGTTFDVILGLPVTDLNSASLNPATQIQNVANRLTFYKMLPEIAANYSVFFQGPIRKGYAPTVAAPEIVKDLPEGLKKKFGVKKFFDKKTGKMVWGWDAKADYIARQLPETNFAIQQMTKGEGSRGQTNKLSAVALATGVKLTPFDPSKKKLEDAYKEHSKLNDRISALSTQYKKKGTPEYVKAVQRRKELERQINQLETKQGYAAPKYPQKNAGGFGGGGFGGSGFGGSGF